MTDDYDDEKWSCEELTVDRDRRRLHEKNGLNVQLWSCDAVDENMEFEVRDGEDIIRWARNPSKCLDVSGGKLVHGTNIQLWDCNVYNEFQQFLYPKGDLLTDGTPPPATQPPSDGEGTPAPVPPTPPPSFNDGQLDDGTDGSTKETFIGSIGWGSRPSKCLDISAGGTHNGNNVETWDCYVDAPNQVFVLPKGDGPIRWKANPHKCLHVDGGKQKSGTNVQIWDCGDDAKGPNMQFRVPDVNGEAGPIRWATHPEWCFDISEGSLQNGANVQLGKCGDGAHPNMQFSV